MNQLRTIGGKAMGLIEKSLVLDTTPYVAQKSLGLYGAVGGVVVGTGLATYFDGYSYVHESQYGSKIITRIDVTPLFAITSMLAGVTLARAYPVATMYTPHVATLGLLLSGLCYGTIRGVTYFGTNTNDTPTKGNV
jgi:hypothetical protein